MNIPPRSKRRLENALRKWDEVKARKARKERLRDRVFTAVVVAVWVIAILVILRRVLP